MRASEIASLTDGRLLGDDVLLKRLSPLYCAQEGDLSLVAWPKDTKLARKTKASCLLAPLSWVADYADEIEVTLIAIDTMDEAFKALANLQAQGFLVALERVVNRFIDTRATVAPSAFVGRAHVAARVSIGPNAFIGDDVVLEEDVEVYPGAVVHGPTRIGERSKIGSNSVIGFAPFVPLHGESLSPLGGVEIAHDVELGALCTVDRGLLGLTRIMERSRLDNMVHCGHDVFIGSDVVIAGQSGLAGFAQVGSGATIGGQAGVGPQIVIGEGARLSGKSFAHSDIGALEIWSGNPSLPHAHYLRAYGKARRDKGRVYGRSNNDF